MTVSKYLQAILAYIGQALKKKRVYYIDGKKFGGTSDDSEAVQSQVLQNFVDLGKEYGHYREDLHLMRRISITTNEIKTCAKRSSTFDQS